MFIFCRLLQLPQPLLPLRADVTCLRRFGRMLHSLNQPDHIPSTEEVYQNSSSPDDPSEGSVDLIMGSMICIQE